MSKELIRKLRLDMGLSQADLAQRVGVTTQTINLVESGKYNPTLKLCKRIAKELGASLEELFGDY